ncbi:carboxylesterase/lipase family protein [Alteromonas gilva]|uniref:Carboxylic ester hydrolase n=1 Tax=Alteromonas gilva TaxID=2987522 RepID=A0ABT5L4L4_9ALTE|nr:carboxylesterase family protein [Alteromonas gilva]MDC8831987.1 carboxylesterase family protein [Alteromonas gilva]
MFKMLNQMLNRTLQRVSLFLLSVILMACAGTQSPNQVTVTGGTIEGSLTPQLAVFKGIPFAAPPVGDLRWRPPQPVTPWQGVKQTTDYGNDCMQLPFPSDAAPLGKTPAEDCLYANVWAPKDADGTTPVLVWIYGGGFVNGGSSPEVYDGSKFAQQGVVFVSFNYRLGRFGFFAHPALTDEAQENGDMLGNYAYMDQIAALKWVHNNISSFGGDPDNVTIMGESAGGGSVLAMMQAEQARGLFDRAIIMSGGGRSLFGDRKVSEATQESLSGEQYGLNYAEKHGITGTDAEALAALRALDAETVVDGLNLAAMFNPAQTNKPTWAGGPMQDGELITQTISDALQQGNLADVDVMVGATSMDIGGNPFKDKDALFASFGEYAEQARKVYDPSGQAPFQVVGYAVGQDRTMQEPARYIAEQMTSHGQQAYYYRFGTVAQSSDNPGAPHASDIPFFFDTVAEKYGDALTQQDQAAASAIHQYIVSFAKTGKPVSDNAAQWQVFAPEQSNMLNMTRNGDMQHGTDPWKARLDVVKAAVESSN